MSSSGAIRGYGSVVNFIHGDPEVTTQILGIDAFDVPNQARPNIDVTHLNSPDDTEEAIRGMKPIVEWAIEHHYVPDSAMDVAIRALDLSGEDFTLEIIAKNAQPRRYLAYVNGYIPKGISAKNEMMAETTLTIKAKISG